MIRLCRACTWSRDDKFHCVGLAWRLRPGIKPAEIVLRCSAG
jgi:hypothetical protein